VRFGVVGSNFITDRIIAAGRLDERFELAGLYSRTPGRAAEYAARHSIPHTFATLEDMASSPLIDAIYIASPNALHAPQSILCLEHGKHVLCEKPLASNAREAREMAAAARHNGRTLMEAMKPTLTPNFRVIEEYLPRIGTPRRWFAAFGKYSSRYDRLKAGELPNAFDPTLANGAAMDIGVYAIYPMVTLFGAPERVQATVVVLPTGVDSHGAVNFTYPDGMLATVLYSKVVDMALPWEIEGEAGTIRGNAINSITRLEFRARDTTYDAERGGADGTGWLDITATGHCGNDYFYEIAHFIDLVEGGRVESPVNTHAVSVATLEIVDELRRQSGIVYPADSAAGRGR
jgi:predicted dehydrogenase